jgi:peptidoglycan/LPS O-acetylase OafA/YrhL
VSPFTLVAIAAAAVLAGGWLLVVFLRPSPGRTAIEWVATTALYLTLGSWFLGLSLEAHAEARTALLIPFGFLAFLFCTGFCVSTWKTVAQVAGRDRARLNATN